MASEFPTSVDQLSAEWLTGVLHANGVVTADTAVTTISSSSLGEGVGMMSDLSLLTVSYEGPNPGPATVVAKFSASNEGNRAVAQHFNVYEREIRFFRDIAPQVDVAVPTPYGAFVDAATCDSVLLMEDLSDFRVGDQIVGCDAEEAGRILDTIVPLHAAFWDKADDPSLDWVMHVASEVQNGGISDGARAGWEPMLSTFGKVVPDEVRAAGPKFLERFQEVYLQLGDGVLTVVHGDVRLDNIMFGTKPGHRPVLLLDWQGFMRSMGMQDVAYLLTQNLHTADRKAHTDALIDRYLAGLAAHGVIYDRDQAWADYRLCALGMFGYAVVIAGTLDPSNERGTQFMSALVERACSAFVDLRLDELL